MAATSRTNAELQRKAKLAQKGATDPIEKLRLACLSRGASGIKGLGRFVSIVLILLSIIIMSVYNWLLQRIGGEYYSFKVQNYS